MCNTCIMGIPEEKKEKIKQKIFETIMTRNFPKLMSDTKLQIQETQKTPRRVRSRRSGSGVCAQEPPLPGSTVGGVRFRKDQ